MQTKFSYRAVKWTMFMGMAAALASACVVSTGDGDGKDIIVDGGESGSSSTSGTKNTGGTKAGSSGSGGTSAGTSGSSTAGGEGGSGGEPYVPGFCEADSVKTPSMLPSCDAKPDDNDCGACLKVKCCDSLQACYGTEPTSACGYGPKSEEDLGQFDCIIACYEENADGVKSQAEVITDCAGECALQCADVGDGLINGDTQDLLDCAQNGEDGDMAMGMDDCNDVCFPPPM